MKIIRVKNPDSFAKRAGPPFDKKTAQKIINDVRRNGDFALKRFEKKFTGVEIKSFRVSKREISDAYDKVSKDQIAAINEAKGRLTRTESALKKRLAKFQVRHGGISITKSFVPIPSVGCYVPGGLAKYPSSAIMSIVPAKIAGVERVAVATPPGKNGIVDPLVLVAADMCGADEIYKVGGAHAIAALAYGTESILPVDKIVGPGGAIVTAAKFLVSDIVGIDMLAGPTELAILADGSADANLIALDLISQSEHSMDTICCLVTTSERLALDVIKKLDEKADTVSRGDIVRTSLDKNGFVALCKNIDDAVRTVENIAPEHLQIMVKNTNKIANTIRASGLVLVGNTPSSASDYLLGTNHILPTNRFGRSRGSLSVLDFVKVQTTAGVTRDVLRQIEKSMKILTDSEGLQNHYEAVRGRL
ncbi:MAG: histidinol dehydrogenase [Candidatus Nitrosotenuis sp.]